MSKDAKLPFICIETNEPAAIWVTRHLFWHPAWCYLLLLIALPTYIVAALVFSEKAEVELAYCAECVRRRNRSRLVAYGIALAVVAMTAITAYLQIGDKVLAGLLVALALVLMIMAVLIWEFVSDAVRAARITKDYLWLKGGHPEFLDSLAPFPGE